MSRRYRIGNHHIEINWWVLGGIVLFWLTFAIYEWAHR